MASRVQVVEGVCRSSTMSEVSSRALLPIDSSNSHDGPSSARDACENGGKRRVHLIPQAAHMRLNQAGKRLCFDDLEMPLSHQSCQVNIGDTSYLDVIENKAALQMYCTGLVVKIGPAEIARPRVKPDA
jgi:hypothetical protein